MQGNDARLTVRLPADLLAAVDRIAASWHRKRADVVRLAVIFAVEAHAAAVERGGENE